MDWETEVIILVYNTIFKKEKIFMKDSITIVKDSLNRLLATAKKYSEINQSVDWTDFWIIVAIVLVSGILGGLVNYYYNLKKTPDENEVHTLKRSIVIGVGAAIVVPIFLEVTQSKVLQGVINNELNQVVLLVSFCVLAAISSTRFISSVSDSVMSRLEKVEKKANVATETAQEAGQKAEVSIKATEQRGGTKTLPETTKRLLSATESTQDINMDDPQKGQFGGKAQQNGFELTLARAEEIKSVKGWYELTFKVKALEPETKPLKGEVTFHLHPTFKPSVEMVKVVNGVALLSKIAWGAFTIGAELEDGTRLEYDLAENMDLPEDFRKR